MGDNEFQVKLADLISQANGLPEEQRAALMKMATDTKARHEAVRKTMAELQEAIDYLRLSTKYLVFDLEATRRENAHLRSLIAQRLGSDVGEEGSGGYLPQRIQTLHRFRLQQPYLNKDWKTRVHKVTKRLCRRQSW